MRVMLLAHESTAGNDTIIGFDGNDTINAGADYDAIDGGAGHDTITGGRSNDVINGGEGSDSYVYARCDGNDTITEGNWAGTSDTLVFSDINPKDVSASFSGADLLIHIAETTAGAGDAGSILIRGTLGTPYDQGVESINFADGTKWNAAQIRALAIASAQTGGNDTITGFGSADTYAGGRGNYVINGGDGNDSLCPRRWRRYHHRRQLGGASGTLGGLPIQ